MDVFDAIQLPDYSTVERLITHKSCCHVSGRSACPILLRDSADRIQLGPD